MATVEAEGLTRSYGSVLAVDRLSFAVEEGRILGVLGPNGAGKTTAIRMLTTILRPSSGRFAVAGVPGERQRDVRRRIGVLPESAGYPARETGEEYLAYHGRLHGRPPADALATARRLLTEVGLADRARRAHPDLQPRDAAAARDRPGSRQRPGGRLPRRAHARARPAGSAGRPRDGRADGERAGRDGAHLDPPPRRGGAGVQRRPDLEPRPGGRARPRRRRRPPGGRTSQREAPHRSRAVRRCDPRARRARGG